MRVGLSATVKALSDGAIPVGAGRLTSRSSTPATCASAISRWKLPRSPLELVMGNEGWDELTSPRRSAPPRPDDAHISQQPAPRRTGDAIHRGARRCGKSRPSRQTLEGASLSVGNAAEGRRAQGPHATSSLELARPRRHRPVCQMGSPRLISELLQRVGRPGQRVGAITKGDCSRFARDSSSAPPSEVSFAASSTGYACRLNHSTCSRSNRGGIACASGAWTNCWRRSAPGRAA